MIFKLSKLSSHFQEIAMCMRPRKLSPTKTTQYRKCLREMKAEGVEVGAPEPEDSLLDVTVIGGLESLIFNLPNGLAGYAVRVRFVAVQSGLIILEDFEITTKFDNQVVAEYFEGLPLCRVCTFRSIWLFGISLKTTSERYHNSPWIGRRDRGREYSARTPASSVQKK